jgi:hypothetical protein
MKCIIKQIPNTITSMNLLCGALGVIAAFKGWMDTAFYLMLAGAVCDFCDGLAARLLKAYSPMGKELDSLADLISFGVAPAMLIFNTIAIQNGDHLTYQPPFFYFPNEVYHEVNLFCKCFFEVFCTLLTFFFRYPHSFGIFSLAMVVHL